MKTRWILAALCVSALTWGVLALVVRSSEQDAARQLFRTLDRHSYYYDAIRSAESSLADATETPEEFEARVRDVEQRLFFLADRLNSLKIKRSVRRELLDPIVHSLRDDRADLASLRDYVVRRGFDEAARVRLEKHVHPPDLFQPAISEIRQRFGLRQRLWRGHRLTV